MDSLEFEQLVNRYYESLYRFALSLSQREAEASDLTQQTFYLWATKGHQLRDKTKVKTWLFTTLHREFLGSRRRETRFPHHDVEAVDNELPSIQPVMVNQIDGTAVLDSLMRVDELYRAPLMLFYLEQHSYLEIAELLSIPPGTVMSRLARGKDQLRKLLAVGQENSSANKIVPLDLRTRQLRDRHG